MAPERLQGIVGSIRVGKNTLPAFIDLITGGGTGNRIAGKGALRPAGIECRVNAEPVNGIGRVLNIELSPVPGRTILLRIAGIGKKRGIGRDQLLAVNDRLIGGNHMIKIITAACLDQFAPIVVIVKTGRF